MSGGGPPSSPGERGSWPLPPFAQLTGFLPADEHGQLLDWVLEHENAFRPAEIIDHDPDPKGVVDAEFRTGLTMRDIGPLRPLLETRLYEALPALEQATGGRGGATSLELELAAHGDGAHYNAHTDISVGPRRKIVGAAEGEDRVLSAVYYFYREPKSFSGGALRLYRLSQRPSTAAGNSGDYVDVEPLENSLVAFPAFATHEVRLVRCPSKDFRDYRFALNCWFCRKL